jgi:glucan 1,3-beta-glucosidase
VSGADDYLRKAIDWARTTSPPLKVVIDLHGAPGSQNGYDNSGQRTKTPTWLTDGGVNGPTANQTLCILEAMAQKYACPEYEDVVVAIELLNEPQGWRLNRQDLINFYREGFKRVRSNSGDTVVVLQDAFDRPESWNGVLTPQDGNAQRVALGKHELP